jgi:hypothetical protein
MHQRHLPVTALAFEGATIAIGFIYLQGRRHTPGSFVRADRLLEKQFDCKAELDRNVFATYNHAQLSQSIEAEKSIR